MTPPAGRPEQPEPFLRGAAFRPTEGVPYPRARDDARLPRDTWAQACIPAGVRLEFAGDAEVISIQYRAETADAGFRGAGGGLTFQLWDDEGLVAEEPAVVGEGIVQLATGGLIEAGVIYLPEIMRPTVLSVQPVGGGIEPRPARPSWVAYGDSILEGWMASAPPHGWAAVTGRRHGLDLLVNMGYAGSARGELASAEHLASRDADAYSITCGTNCWSVVPHSTDMMRANLDALLDVVRARRPETPIVVMSPLLRPDAEDTPNALGVTLADLRKAMEAAVGDRIAVGDDRLILLGGFDVLDELMLLDGIHPDDSGHAAIAAVMGAALEAAISA
ncbi:MAG: GDSL family lipase [Actinobacteria bacterium]|nr:GDSL family lipase [Actinomycetota bacterium]